MGFIWHPQFCQVQKICQTNQPKSSTPLYSCQVMIFNVHCFLLPPKSFLVEVHNDRKQQQKWWGFCTKMTWTKLDKSICDKESTHLISCTIQQVACYLLHHLPPYRCFLVKKCVKKKPKKKKKGEPITSFSSMFTLIHGFEIFIKINAISMSVVSIKMKWMH